MTDDILILCGPNSCLVSLIYPSCGTVKHSASQRAAVRRDLYELIKLIMGQLSELNHTDSNQILSQKY